MIRIRTVAAVALSATIAVAIHRLVAEEPTPTLRKDRVVLDDGTELVGTLLDDTKTEVVIWLGPDEGRRVISRPDVDRVARASIDEKAKEFVEGIKKKATRTSHWRKVASFCLEKELYPERRDALRAIVALEPDDVDARLGLGQALDAGKWLDEAEVLVKTSSGGFTVDDRGRLVASEGRTTTEKATAATPAFRMLPRTALTDAEKKRFDRERAKRADFADEFRAKLERERTGIAWEKRYKVKGRNFEVHCNATQELAQRYLAIMEIIRSKLANHFPSRVVRSGRSLVTIYCNQDEFINNDDFASWGGRGLGGYYMPINQSITTYHGTFGFTGTTFKVLAHEGVHYYQGRVLEGGFDNCPIWLIEGLAVYFGDGSSFDPDKKTMTTGLIPRDRLAHIQEKMLIGRHTPVKKLIAMDRYRFSGSHYADAWALIYFLVKGEKKGELVMKAYWERGMEHKLAPRDFTELAEEIYGSLDALEEEYKTFILGLRPPQAGEIRGNWFVCDDFQFEFQAPSEDWQFFEDGDDKKLIVGLLLPDTSAQIRIYFENNFDGKERKDFFRDYERAAKRFEGFSSEECKIAGIDGYRVRYVDDGEFDLADLGIYIGDDGEIDIPDPSDLAKANEKREAGERDVMKYLLIQVDGVAAIECSTKKGEMAKFEELFRSMNENFHLLLTRRW